MRKIELQFFKKSGKYYTSEEVEFHKDEPIYDIMTYIQYNEKRYSGMDIYLKFDDDDDIGFPIIIRASQRKY